MLSEKAIEFMKQDTKRLICDLIMLDTTEVTEQEYEFDDETGRQIKTIITLVDHRVLGKVK